LVHGVGHQGRGHRHTHAKAALLAGVVQRETFLDIRLALANDLGVRSKKDQVGCAFERLADASVALEAIFASAIIRTLNVRAVGVGRAVVRLTLALIDVYARVVIVSFLVTIVADAMIRAHGVLAVGMMRAGEQVGRFTFIDVLAMLAISLEAALAFARIVQRTRPSLDTRGIFVAVMHSLFATVNSLAVETVADVARLAGALIAALGVGTKRVLVAGVRLSEALIDICAGHAISFIARHACAAEAADRVRAVGLGAAVMRAQFALVDVVALEAIALKSLLADALVAADRVPAVGVLRANVLPLGALVHIGNVHEPETSDRLVLAAVDRVVFDGVGANEASVEVSRKVIINLSFNKLTSLADLPSRVNVAASLILVDRDLLTSTQLQEELRREVFVRSTVDNQRRECATIAEVAVNSVSLVSIRTGAAETSVGVHARSPVEARITTRLALVDIFTCYTIAFVSSLTPTFQSRHRIHAVGIRMASKIGTSIKKFCRCLGFFVLGAHYRQDSEEAEK